MKKLYFDTPIYLRSVVLNFLKLKTTSFRHRRRRRNFLDKIYSDSLQINGCHSVFIAKPYFAKIKFRSGLTKSMSRLHTVWQCRLSNEIYTLPSVFVLIVKSTIFLKEKIGKQEIDSPPNLKHLKFLKAGKISVYLFSHSYSHRLHSLYQRLKLIPRSTNPS